MEELGKSPHTDWTNVSIAQLRSANFPIYVTFQEPGDLIVYPSATQQVQQAQQTNGHDKDVQSRETKESTPPSQPTRSGKGKSHPSSVARTSRKREWRFGLPFAFWRQIIADAVGADGILSYQQQVRIMAYAADWNAVSYELTIKGAEDHQQIWKFLETVKCITYSSLT